MEKEAVKCAVLIFVTASAGQDIQTKCPGFTEGVQSTIDCTVNRTYYDSCFPAPVLVTFRFLNGGSSIQWCDTSYTSCATTGQSQRECNGCSCQCSHKNLTTKINKYSLTFVPNVTYNGGSFYCEIACAVPSSPETEDHASCANAKVGVPAPVNNGSGGLAPVNNGSVNSTSTTPGDTESRSSSTLVIGLVVAGCVCVVMAAVGFYCFRKRRPGGQNDAPPANAPRDNAAPDNAPRDNAAPDNAPPDNAAPDNAAPDNGPQGTDTAGASTGQTVPTTPADELDESSVAGSEASEASEGTEDTASQVSEV